MCQIGSCTNTATHTVTVYENDAAEVIAVCEAHRYRVEEHYSGMYAVVGPTGVVHYLYGDKETAVQVAELSNAQNTRAIV